MSDRTPATEKGTADRVEADDGGYWVRLVTKQALKREGECMGNCLAFGEHDYSAGEEDLVSDSIWSLRKSDGVSYLDIHVDTMGRERADIDEAHGPKNSQPAGWSIRQLRHLVVAFRDAGATLRVPESIALTGEDGRTWRPDKAPQEVRDAIEARKKAEVEARRKERADNPTPQYEILSGQVMIRPAGSSEPFVLAGDIAPLSFGPDTQDQSRADLGISEADYDAHRRGIIHHIEARPDGKRITLRFPFTSDVLRRNGDGTWALHYNGADQPAEYPVVAVTSEMEEFWDTPTVTVRTPAPRVVRRRYGHIREQAVREVSARLRESITGVTACELRTGPDTIEGMATIPAGARDGDLFEFIGPGGGRLYNVTVAEADVAANRITVHSGMDLFCIHGDRTEEATFPFTAPEQEVVPVTPRMRGRYVMLGTHAAKDEIVRRSEERDVAGEIHSGIELDEGGPPVIHTITPPLG